jgi:hypothetical protein
MEHLKNCMPPDMIHINHYYCYFEVLPMMVVMVVDYDGCYNFQIPQYVRTKPNCGDYAQNHDDQRYTIIIPILIIIFSFVDLLTGGRGE